VLFRSTPRLSLEQLRRGLVRGGEGRTAAIGQVGEIGAQFKDFFQRPTVSGFSSLMSTGSTAGKAMAGLASVVGVALPIIGAVVAVVGLTIAAFKMLKAAAEQVAERIREVARYSGELTSAVVGERIAELNRQLHEAAENGKAYAAVQRSATVAGNAWGSMMINVNKITSGFAVLWHSITAGFAQSVGPAIKAFGYVGEWFATNFGAGGNFDGLTTAFKVITDMGVLLFGGPLALGKIIEWLRLLLVKLGIIADNTKPKSTAAVNDWFRADVHAMTGRAY